MNNCVINSKDGKNIVVSYSNKYFNYSVESSTIDTTELIEKICERELYDKIIVDKEELETYISNNYVSDEFKELFNFIESIFVAYNKAIDDINDSD